MFKDYSEENSIIVIKVQFLALEIARNREGFNDEIRDAIGFSSFLFERYKFFSFVIGILHCHILLKLMSDCPLLCTFEALFVMRDKFVGKQNYPAGMASL